MRTFADEITDALRLAILEAVKIRTYSKTSSKGKTFTVQEHSDSRIAKLDKWAAKKNAKGQGLWMLREKLTEARLKMHEGVTVPNAKAYLRTYVNTKPDDKGHVVHSVNEKGKFQPIYLPKAVAERGAQHWEKILELEPVADRLTAKMTGNKPEAAIMRLISHTFMRVADETTKPPIYGARTLEGRHIVEKGGKVFAKFVGKDKIANSYQIHDSKLAKDLVSRAKAAGPNGRIFGDVSYATVLKYSSSLTHGDSYGFTPHNWRTLGATTIARQMIKSLPKPATLKEYKASRNHIGDVVATHLNNGRDKALNSYIHPIVFSGWLKGLK